MASSRVPGAVGWPSVVRRTFLFLFLFLFLSLAFIPFSSPRHWNQLVQRLASYANASSPLTFGSPALSYNKLSHHDHSVDISHNAGLSNIDGFRTLASTESITIADCASLTRVVGFYRVNFVNGPVSIERNPALVSVAFLNNCSRIEGTHLCEPQSMSESGEREVLMGLRTLSLLSNQLRFPSAPTKI